MCIEKVFDWHLDNSLIIYIYICVCVCVCACVCVCVCVLLFRLLKYILGIPKSETREFYILQALVLWINMYINIF